MDDLITWLRAQLDDDEWVARRAGADWPDWTYDRETFHVASSAYSIAARKADRSPINDVDGEHIVRHDPARVLAEVDAKRRLLDEYGRALARRKAHPDDLASAGALLAMLRVIKLLALPRADREGYREEWRPE